MKKIMFIPLFLLLAVCFISLSGCDDSGDDSVSLSIYIKNETSVDLKKIYWVSDEFAGVIDIDVPEDTETTITNEILPGTEFQFKITTSNTDEYVLWEDISTVKQDGHLTELQFLVKPLESCLLMYMFCVTGSGSLSGKNSTANTLPSI